VDQVAPRVILAGTVNRKERLMANLTEEIVNAIISGISSDDIAIEQMLAIVERLDRAGYVIISKTEKS
jgi:hypothetical protein